jgi:hypothetical protein
MIKNELPSNETTNGDNSSALINSLHSPYLQIDPSLLDVSVHSTIDSLNSISINSNENDSKKSQPQSNIDIDIFITEMDQPKTVYNLNVPLIYTPAQIIIDIIKEKMNKVHASSSQIEQVIEQYKNSYVLNVCGCEEIFHGNKYPIQLYKVIISFQIVCF